MLGTATGFVGRRCDGEFWVGGWEEDREAVGAVVFLIPFLKGKTSLNASSIPSI
jgi:hypothetical protein